MSYSIMRAIVRNMSDMSDSREMMEARTSPAITAFIVILLVLIVSALTWSFIGEIDEVAKAPGVVRPNEKVSTIQTSSLGQVEKVYVKEGMHVDAGTVLISLDQQELQIELSNREAEMNKLKLDLELLQRYKKSIESGKNLFAAGKSEESFYYDLVEQFHLEYHQKELEFQSADQQMISAKTETIQSQDSLKVSMRSSEQKVLQDKKALNRKIKLLTSDLEQERKLKLSMQSKTNKISSSDKKRTAQFGQYVLRLEQLDAAVGESKAVYERSVELGERFVPKAQLEEELAKLEAAKLQLSQYQQEAMLGVESNIFDYEYQLGELNNSLSLLNEKHSPAALELESLMLQQQQLADKQQSLTNQGELTNQSEITALEKYKLDRVVQIQMTMEEKKKSLDTLNENAEQLEVAIDKRTLTSPVSGTVNVLKEMNTGGIVQAGEALLSIIPSNETKYKISIAVPNHEIGKIALGNKVELNFQAFPKQSFGSLTGVVTSISTDAVVQQDGLSYYVVEASIANEPLTNRKGERGEIRVGMTAEAYVITDSKKIIQYVLEKINLRE